MPLYHAYNALTNTRGDSLVGFRVQARVPNGGAIAPIYSDSNGTPIAVVSGIANTAITDDAGNYSFFIEANANYDLEYSTPEGAFVSATRNVPLFAGIEGPAGPQGEGLADVMAPTGSTKVGTQAPGGVAETVASAITRVVLTPEQFGAVGYPTRDAASAGPFDSTAAIQAFYNAMSSLGVAGSGNNRWYRCGNAEVQSNTDLRAISFFQKAGSVDASPFAITSKNNITLTDCRVDGNRLNQTNLTTSGGDGQRSGFKIYGRCDNIRLIRPVAEYCATEGIHCWIGNATPANGTDYLQSRVYIEEPICNWNGRHGISTASQRGFRLIGGSGKNNGMDVPGASGPYSNGGWARTVNGTLGGPKYGRALTAESYLPGEGYDGWEVDGFDGRGNIGGLLLYHRVWPGQTSPCSDTMIRNCKFDDPFGGNGDGSGLVYAINNSTNAAYTGSDAFDGLRILNTTFGRNYINVNSAQDITIEGGSAVISTGNYSVIFTNCGTVLRCNIPSNKPVLGRPSPVSLGAVAPVGGWTVTSPVMSTPSDGAGSRLRYYLAFTVTPTGSGTVQFRLPFTAGWAITPGALSGFDSNTGVPITGNLAVRPGTNGANEVDLFVASTGASPLVVSLQIEAERVP